MSYKAFFFKHNRPVDSGTHVGKPLYPRTAVIVYTNQKKVILARKCFGPTGTKMGERDLVKHPVYIRGRSPVYSLHGRGAAGTPKSFWGTWGTFGGTNHPRATSNLEAGKLEVCEEGDVNMSVVNQLEFQHSFVTSRTMCYIAYCPNPLLRKFKHLDKPFHNMTSKKALIFSSHGEIAQLRLVDVKDLDGFHRRSLNGVASYARKSFKEFVLPFLRSLS